MNTEAHTSATPRERRIGSAAHYLTLAAAALAALALLYGAMERYDAAKRDCPDWPECHRVSVSSALAATAEANAETGRAVSPGYVIDGALALALAGLAALGWARRAARFDRRWAIPLTALLLVTSGAVAPLLDAGGRLGALWRLLAGEVTLALLWWLVLRELRFWRPPSGAARARALRPRAAAAIALVLLQMALGGWGMAQGIGLPCQDFPACRGEWWPSQNLLSALATAYAGRPALPEAVGLHWAHRLGGFVVLLYVGWLGLHVWRVGERERFCRYGVLVLGALFAAVAIGIMAVANRLPPVAALAHSGAAALLLLSLVTLYHVARPPRAA